MGLGIEALVLLAFIGIVLCLLFLVSVLTGFDGSMFNYSDGWFDSRPVVERAHASLALDGQGKNASEGSVDQNGRSF